MRPEWAKDIAVGDVLTVKDEMFSRGGQSGTVTDEPDEEGVALDFFCDVFGNALSVPSIEFYEWGEIEPTI